MGVSAVIVAGGRGIRMGGNIRKQYLSLAGEPLLCHCLRAFDACKSLSRIFLVVPENDQDFCRDSVLSAFTLRKKIRIISGGKERQDSVRNGVLAAGEYGGIVAIHDGVRPFVLPEQIESTVAYAEKYGAAMLAIPASDTLKQADARGNAVNTLDRGKIWLAQTPQTFQYDLIRTAHESAQQSGYRGTDDASLAERTGKKIRIIPGSRFNIKITTPEDLMMAEALYPVFREMFRPS